MSALSMRLARWWIRIFPDGHRVPRDGPETRFVGEMQKLKVEPDDVFVLTCEDNISDATAQRLKDQIEDRLHGAKCLVLGGGLKLGVVQLPDFEKSVTDVMVKAGVLVRPSADG